MRLRSFSCFAVVLLTSAMATQTTHAQTRRALIVGIDHYAPPGKSSRAFNAQKSADSMRGPITDLDGAVNDADSFRRVLLEHYAFEASHVRIVPEKMASRVGILAEIDKLLAESKSGDLVVFYYAGHGSEQRNSKSREARGLDQTIVPYDANITGQDIRDKEIARSFNRFLDKGVRLTLIFDSCHSGSIARSPASYKARWAPYNPVDAADGDMSPSPETRGAIILSAAQDYEVANETRDLAGTPHGAFTSALIRVLTAQSPTAPATRTFAQTRAILQAEGLRQEPVLQGSAERTRRPLFAPDGPVASGHITTTVLLVRNDTLVEIGGGAATGLVQNAEFRAVDSRDSTARLRITSTVSGTRSVAVRFGGRGRPHVGDSYELDKWPAGATGGVSVWMPDETPTNAVLHEIAAALNQLEQQPGIEWVSDPTAAPEATAPTVVLRYHRGNWVLYGTRDTAVLSAHPSAAAIATAAQKLADEFRARLKGEAHAAGEKQSIAPGVRVTAVLPPSKGMLDMLQKESKDTASIARFVRVLTDANYLLVGRPTRDNGVEYAWLRPDASRESASLSTLPARTKWLGGADSTIVGPLMDDALTLARVRTWLNLDAPADALSFPYHLAFKNPRTGTVSTTGPFRDGDKITIVLQLDSTAKTEVFKPRRVYVFVIDASGTATSLFPQEEGNNGNTVPARVPGAPLQWNREVAFPADQIVIREPFGMDTYFLLTVPSSETVPLEALNWNMTRSVRPPGGAIATLLFNAAGTTRSSGQAVPTDWSIERVSILSVPKPAKP